MRRRPRSDDLFAEKLTGERAQAHDMSQGLGVPQPSESIPTEITFCICSPSLPGRLEKTRGAILPLQALKEITEKQLLKPRNPSRHPIEAIQ